MISLTSPVRTVAHGWPAGVKLGLLCAATLGLYALSDPRAMAAVVAAVVGLYALPGRVFLRTGLGRLWVLWPFVVILTLWHAATGALADGATVILRMIAAVALANLVTMTTSLSDMMSVMRALMRPLRLPLRVTRAVEIAVAMVIRMTPVLLDKGLLLAQSWRARSTRRANWNIVLPFVLVALDDAERVAEALKARGGIATDEANRHGT